MGRFMQQDPMGITPIIAAQNRFTSIDQYADGMNLYEYVKNNPVRYIDPFGLTPTECEIAYLKCRMDAKDAKSACQNRGWVACGVLCLGAPETYPVCVLLCRLAYEVVCDMGYDKAMEKCEAANANCCK
jgi:hypothetical protein